MQPQKIIKITLFYLPFILFSCAKEEKSTEGTEANQVPTYQDPDCEALAQVYSPSSESTPLSLYVDQRITSYIQKQIPPKIEATLKKDSLPEKTFGPQRFHEFSFSIDQVPLCDHHLRAHMVKDSLVVIGNPPPRKLEIEDKYHWPLKKNLALTKIRTELGKSDSLKALNYKKCLYQKNNQLLPLWEVEVEVDSLPYYSLLDDQHIYQLSPLYFDLHTASGSAQVFARTESDPSLTLKTVSLTGLSTGGTLCSARFRTLIAESVHRAHSSSHEFFFAPQNLTDTIDPRFLETSLFTNSHLFANWITTISSFKKWIGPRIHLIVADTEENKTNTAVYFPPSQASINPRIAIGRGTGNHLQNLIIDPEPVQHEVSHHLVYPYLPTITGESLVLHEGIADSFVFLATNNPCLGESICPEGGNICTNDQCLRTADNTLTLETAKKLEYHAQGQLISGIIWNLRKTLGLPQTTALLFKGVEFLVPKSGYKEFINALLLADKDLNSSQNCQTIMEELRSRGFEDLIEDNEITCEPSEDSA